MSSWDSLRRIAAIGDKATVDRLACPECGGALIVSYGKGDPTRGKPRGYSSLSVICTTCLGGITSDGTIGTPPPPWAEECGGRMETLGGGSGATTEELFQRFLQRR